MKFYLDMGGTRRLRSFVPVSKIAKQIRSIKLKTIQPPQAAHSQTTDANDISIFAANQMYENMQKELIRPIKIFPHNVWNVPPAAD